MVKNKRKANLAKSTADKKKKTERVNPFEIRFNREKHSVLNRKTLNVEQQNIQF